MPTSQNVKNVNVANDAAAIAAGIDPPPSTSTSASTSTISDAFPSSSLTTAHVSSASIKFNDVDSAIDVNNAEHSIHAPKTEERLEQISNERYMQRKLQEEEDDDGAQDRLKIGDDVQLDVFDVQPIEEPSRKLNFEAPELDDIEILA